MRRILSILPRTAPRPTLIVPSITRPLRLTPRTATMSSDADYAAFLDKANQDTGASSQKQDKGFAQTKAVDTEVPGPISGLDAFYMSETDEPFEPVALKFEGAKLDEGEFGPCLVRALGGSVLMARQVRSGN